MKPRGLIGLGAWTLAVCTGLWGLGWMYVDRFPTTFAFAKLQPSPAQDFSHNTFSPCVHAPLSLPPRSQTTAPEPLQTREDVARASALLQTFQPARKNIYVLLSGDVESCDRARRREVEKAFVRQVRQRYPDACLFVWPRSREQVQQEGETPFPNEADGCLRSLWGEHGFRSASAHRKIRLWPTPRVMQKLSANMTNILARQKHNPSVFLYFANAKDTRYCTDSSELTKPVADPDEFHRREKQCKAKRAQEMKAPLKVLEAWPKHVPFQIFFTDAPHRPWSEFCRAHKDKCTDLRPQNHEDTMAAIFHFVEGALASDSAAPSGLLNRDKTPTP